MMMMMLPMMVIIMKMMMMMMMVMTMIRCFNPHMLLLGPFVWCLGVYFRGRPSAKCTSSQGRVLHLKSVGREPCGHASAAPRGRGRSRCRPTSGGRRRSGAVGGWLEMGFSSKQKYSDEFHLTTEGLEAWSPHVCDFVIGFAEHVGCESALIEADSTLAAHD